MTSFAPDNHLRLHGSGSEGSPMTGFADLVMAGTAWTLSGELATTGQAANTVDVQTGTLTLTGVLTTGFGGGATIASGAGLTIGTGGVTGFFAGDVVDNGVLTLNRSNNLVFAFDISGTGSVVKRGAGTTVLDGANSYSGGTRIEAGVLSVWNDGDLGNVTGGLTFDGGTLRALAPLASARAVTVEDGGGTIDTSNVSATLSGPLSGASPAPQDRLGSAGPDGRQHRLHGDPDISIPGPCRSGRAEPRAPSPRIVNNSGNLIFNRATDLTFDAPVAGSGTIVKQGSNTLTLSDNVSSTSGSAAAIDVRSGVLVTTARLQTAGAGRFNVASGALLSIGNGGPTGLLVGNVVNNGAVVFNSSADSTYHGPHRRIGHRRQAGRRNAHADRRRDQPDRHHDQRRHREAGRRRHQRGDHRRHRQQWRADLRSLRQLYRISA